jgi:hypothetical protein
MAREIFGLTICRTGKRNRCIVYSPEGEHAPFFLSFILMSVTNLGNLTADYLTEIRDFLIFIHCKDILA